MTIFEAIILGLVEGLTEYLPVSSTGHLILSGAGLDLPQDGWSKHALDAYFIIIQSGAILAVLGIYRTRVLRMVRGLLGLDPDGRALALKVLLAFLPAAVLGLLFDDWIEAHLFGPWPVVVALAVGGVAMLALHRHLRSRDERLRLAAADGGHLVGFDAAHISWRGALMVGCLQCVAMWPGTSRSMMTLVGAMLVGLAAASAAEFSFLLGLVTLGAATGYKFLKLAKAAPVDLSVPPVDGQTLHLAGAVQLLGGWWPIVIGIVVATVSAFLAVKWMVTFLTRRGLAPFGWYRVVLAAILAGLALGGAIRL